MLTAGSPMCLLVACRPKHLLVFINPFGGKGQGKQIYERKVAPLFSLASITTDIIGKAAPEAGAGKPGRGSHTVTGELGVAVRA